MEDDYLQRLTRAEERLKSNTHRLERLETVVQEIHAMSETMIRLVEEIRHTNDAVAGMDGKIDRLDTRVDELERLPAKDMRHYKNTAVTTVISTVTGALVTGLAFMALQYL